MLGFHGVSWDLKVLYGSQDGIDWDIPSSNLMYWKWPLSLLIELFEMVIFYMLVYQRVTIFLGYDGDQAFRTRLPG